MSEFQTYQRFPNVEVAQPLLQLLHAHGIAYETRLDQPSVDPLFSFNATNVYFLVQLRPDDFAAARALEEQANEELAAQVPPDHYLFAFGEDELREVLRKADEWSGLDVALARRILRERGQEVSSAEQEQLHQRRLRELAQPEPRSPTWLVLGYALALLGGAAGLLIGWHLYAHQRRLPDGTQVPAFCPQDRAHGLRMLVLGASVLLGVLVLGGVRYLRQAH